MSLIFSLRWLLVLLLLAVVGWLCWRSLRHDHS